MKKHRCSFNSLLQLV